MRLGRRKQAGVCRRCGWEGGSRQASVDDEAGKEEAGRHLSVKVLATRLKPLDFILQATRSD